jgi:hypothetical protein
MCRLASLFGCEEVANSACWEANDKAGYFSRMHDGNGMKR